METAQFKDEVWKTVKVNPYYLVSNYGRIKTIDHPVWCKVNNSYSIRKGIMHKPSNKNQKKYWRIGIQIHNKQKWFSVHRLVAEAFIPNPDNLPQVNHIDGDKNNNHVSNLEWCTNKYNMQHSWKIGLRSGEKISRYSGTRKLTEEQVKFIRQEYEKLDVSVKGTKMKFYREMANKFNLKSPNTIHWVVTRGTSKYF